MSEFHPDLRAARFVPRFSFGPLSSKVMRSIDWKRATEAPGVRVREILVPGPPGDPEVLLRIVSPEVPPAQATPALVWIHGGGLIVGHAAIDDERNFELVRELGITVVSVDYRLAPDDRAPAAVEDCYAALKAVHERTDALGIDPTRIAVGGASAGGGLAAALTQVARDRGECAIAFQLLVYPMLDDRTVLRRDVDERSLRMWTMRSNRYGWSAYLGRAAGSLTVPPYSVPAREADLSGLPPAWIGVGSFDLFYDEDLAYAARLREAGVEISVEIVPGAFHGFDAVFPQADVTRRFFRSQVEVVRKALAVR